MGLFGWLKGNSDTNKTQDNDLDEESQSLADDVNAIMFAEDTSGKKWRLEPVTEQQIKRLESLNFFLKPETLTKGKASDIIGLFEDPSAAEMEILAFYQVEGIDSPDYSQTDARRKINEIFSSPDNVVKWETRDNKE